VLSKLKYSEREAIINALPYNEKLAFVAFCAERCIGEARRHAPEELDRANKLPLALDWLWRAAQGETVDYKRDLGELHRTLDSFEPPADDQSLALGKYDITISKAMLCVDEGFCAIRNPDIALRSVDRAFEAACSTVARIYQASRPMEQNEIAVLDEALRRLNGLGGQPVKREMLADIPDYERGPVSPRYLSNRRRQAVEEEDDET
jgi:hypothetical protein